MPGTVPWVDGNFYSPGLLCPSGWTTATVVTAEMTGSLQAADVFNWLLSGETAAFCCPS